MTFPGCLFFSYSQLAVIKTISAVMPSVQTVEKPEKVEVRSTIRRRRSIKRSGTSGSQRNSMYEKMIYYYIDSAIYSFLML